MKPQKLLLPSIIIFVLLAAVYVANGNHKPTEVISEIVNQEEPIFDQVMSVITHRRCMNCHPSDDYPRQGDDSHYHRFGVQRGPNNNGLAALQCASCHQESNNILAGVPGAPHWSLAPISMGWRGLDKYEIAANMLDRSKNGNRSIAEIEHHLTEDPLVLWAFEPGVDNEGKEREKPPLSKDEWIKAVKEWVATGAEVPRRR